MCVCWGGGGGGVRFEPLRAQSCWFALYRRRAKIRLASDVFKTFVTHTASFLTSLIQTAGHKMAALISFLFIFFDFETSNFNKHDEKSSEKILFLCPDL